jgi:hypothetical protein
MLDDPKKLTERFLNGSDNSCSNWEDAARTLAQELQHMSIKNLPEKMNPLDVLIFKQAMKGIREAFEGVADVLNATKSNRSSEAFMHLRRLMAAAYSLGQSSVMSPNMKKVWLSEFQSQKGKNSAHPNRQKAAAWQGPVLDLARTKRTRNPALTLDDLATQIIAGWSTIDFKGHRPPVPTHSYLVKVLSQKLSGRNSHGLGG